MLRLALIGALAIGACTPAQAPTARKLGKVLALGGVTGLIATSVANYVVDDGTRPLMIGFSFMSAIGIGMYAAGELSVPGESSETVPERNQRWARILTERAYGYARDGRCRRVRHIETRVLAYDRVLHDIVFMRDPAIQKCMAPPDLQPVEPPAVPEVTGP